MKADQLIESMNDINDDYINEYAGRAPVKQGGRYEKWAIAAAACLCVGMIGVIAFMLPHDEVKPPTPPPLQTVVTAKTESTPKATDPTDPTETSFVTESASDTVRITETTEPIPPKESETRHTDTVYEPPQTQAIQTDAPQTDAPQTYAPHTDAPQTDPYTETTEESEICYTVTAYIPDDPATDGPVVDPIGTEDIVTDIVTEIIGGDDDPEPVLGDVDRDGKVTAKDAATLIKFLAGYPIPRSFFGSDINGDFNIDSRDLALLLKSFAAWEDAHK